MLPDRLHYSTMLLHARLSLSRSMIKYSLFVQPCVYLTLVFAVFHLAGSPRTFAQASLTAALVAAWGTVVFTVVGEISRERSLGTLAAIALTSAGLWGAFLRKAAGSALLGGLPLLAWTLLIVVTERPDPTEAALVLTASSLVLFAALAFGLFCASLLVILDKSRFLMNYLELPIFFLSGFFFPTTLLGPGLSRLAAVLPTTWPVAVLRDVVLHQPAPLPPGPALCAGLAIGLAYLAAAWALLRWAEQAARRSGALDEQLA